MSDPEDRIRELENELRAERRRAAHLESELRRLTDRRSVQVTLRLARLARPLLRGARRIRTRTDADSESPPGDRATPQEQEAFSRAVRDRLPPAPELLSWPAVAIVVPTRNGRHHIARLFRELSQTDYPAIEVTVVDNGGTDGTAAWLSDQSWPWPLHMVTNADNESFSTACNQGAGAAGAEFLLFLNDDVTPLEPTWLKRMVAAAVGGFDIIGAQLVYPARPGSDAPTDDLSVQHAGIRFVARSGLPRPVNVQRREPVVGSGVEEHAAVTAAALLIKRDDFEAHGGFDTAYEYGTEDVDLCLRTLAGGGRIGTCTDAVLFHHEFGTQSAAGSERRRLNRIQNRRRFLETWGARLGRDLFIERVSGGGVLSSEPLHVGITVTRDDPTAGYGDWYTAHDLGAALEGLGWRVSYVERYGDRWFDIDEDVDVLVVLLDAFDLRRIRPGAVTVAWVRNWTERWLSRPWFDDYDIVLASSRVSAEMVEERSGHQPILFPLAVAPERFVAGVDGRSVDVVAALNRWNRPRVVESILPDLARRFDVRLFGKGWDGSVLAGLCQGSIDQRELARQYSVAKIVLDDTAEHALPYGAVNARVFDALAAGALVVTDQPEVTTLFDDEFPVYDRDDVGAVVAGLLADQDRREALVVRYRAMLLERHTYQHRAALLRDVLAAWARQPRVGVATGVPSAAEASVWGDEHFGQALRRALRRRGFAPAGHRLADSRGELPARDDAAIHLRGASRFRVCWGRPSMLWIISHPDQVTAPELHDYDLIACAGTPLAAWARERDDEVMSLRQATDPRRFRPGPGPRHHLLFVGNSRGVRREVVDDLIALGYEPEVYGTGWTRRLLPARFLGGGIVPNSELAGWYANADIVVSDHWPDQREAGIVSNRIFDALASGAFVLSDHVEGIADLLPGGLVTYRTRAELSELMGRFEDDREARGQVAARGRELVLDAHTFDHRARQIADWLRSRGLEPEAGGPGLRAHRRA